MAATGPRSGGDRPGPGRIDDLGTCCRRRGRCGGTSGPGRTAWSGWWGADHPDAAGALAGVLLFEDAHGGLARFLRWRGFAAITLGHVIVTNRRLNDGLLAHELEHVAQAERWGPLYYPAYLLGSVRGYRRNPFERAPASGRRRPGRPGGAHPGGPAG